MLKVNNQENKEIQNQSPKKTKINSQRKYYSANNNTILMTIPDN
jgi:hypothetical protein